MCLGITLQFSLIFITILHFSTLLHSLTMKFAGAVFKVQLLVGFVDCWYAKLSLFYINDTSMTCLDLTM
jgi:hypothetical protein